MSGKVCATQGVADRVLIRSCWWSVFFFPNIFKTPKLHFVLSEMIFSTMRWNGWLLNLFTDKTRLAEAVSSHLSQNWLRWTYAGNAYGWVEQPGFPVKFPDISCRPIQWIWGTKRKCAETEGANYPVGRATPRGGQSLGAQRREIFGSRWPMLKSIGEVCSILKGIWI